MAAAVGLLLMILGVSQAHCDVRKDGVQCNVTLGETVFLQLMNNTSGIIFDLKKENVNLLRVSENGIAVNELKDRPDFISNNGTFRINDLKHSDSGIYNLTVFDTNGKLTETQTFHLSVQAVKPFCDGRQDGSQCFGVLGGAVEVQLMDNISEIPSFNWKTNDIWILNWRNEKDISLKNDDRITFFPSNGSVRINDLRRTDSGEYKLDMFDGERKNTGRKTLQLFVIAPVSSVQLVPECLPQGQMKVSCVSQGDSSQYSWTLDGHTLTDSELFSRNTETNIIVLRQNILGHLVCSVRNPFSNSSKGMNLNDCAVKPLCDGRQDGSQCFGVLGGAVEVQLMDNISEIPSFNWKTNDIWILNWRNEKDISLKNDDRITFFPSNGSVRINDLRRTDSGEYKLDMFDGERKNTGRKTLQLFVIAPVSSVQLVPECLPQGQMKVSCVSQGDSPQYNWTLDGHTLTDSELFSRNTETNIILLRQNISGHLVCSVRNQISNSSKGMNLNDCGFIFINCTSNGTRIAKWVYKENNTLCVEPTTVPPTTEYTIVEPSSWLTLGLRSIVVVLPLIGLCLYFTWKQKKYEKAKSSAIPPTVENPEDSVLMVQLSSAP